MSLLARTRQHAQSLLHRVRSGAKGLSYKTRRLFEITWGWRQAPEPTETRQGTMTYTPAAGLLTPADPLNLVVDPALSRTATLNVLLPGVCMRGMSGGPNTIYNLTYRMAEQGVPVRYISTSADMDLDLEPIWSHIGSLAGIPRKLANVSFADGHNRGKQVRIGADDVFLATAWWTAQMVKYALPLVRPQRFLYVIQDFEAVLHEHGTLHALALETYGLDYVPFVNHRFLAEYLTQQKVGRFADPAFANDAVVIDPALDRTRFFPQLAERTGKRRLLFYARPRSAKRNLFELGIAALQRAVQQGTFANEPWEFLAMGDPVAPVELGRGHVLQPAPWRDFDGYAAQMREADVLLSLMLSPHPSYPPLEMAACGGLVVTNSFANKTQASFAAISPNILAPVATIEGIGDALAEAVRRAPDLAARKAGAALASPASWADAFAPVLPKAVAAFHACRGVR